MRTTTHILWLIGALLFAAFILTGCASDDDEPSNDDVDDDTSDDDTGDLGEFEYPYCEINEEKIGDLLQRMSLREKIGQMYLVGAQSFPFVEIEEMRFLIEDVKVGGIFVQPLTGIGFTPSWSAVNVNQLQGMAWFSDPGIPLIISIDQEGGIPQAVNNLTAGTDQPGNLGLGATFDPNASYESYRVMGAELSAIGVNASFSPVAELAISHEETSMYTRCFGEQTEAVADHTAQAVRGLQKNLIMATPKHFPSHSTAPGDEHYDLTVNEEDEQSVRQKYLPPFIDSIEAGADMIMMTHSVYRAWGDEPAVFNKTIVTDLLRNELGFEGLIITDDMNMGSITLNEWDELPDIMAVEAGVDIILDCFRSDPPDFGDVSDYNWPFDIAEQIELVYDAVVDGRISEERIDQSVRRILTAKMKYCLFEDPFGDVGEAKEVLGSPEHMESSRKLHEKAITLVRDEQNLLPLEPNAHVHVVCPMFAQYEMYPDAAWGNIAGTDLLTQVKKVAPNATGDTFLVSDWWINTPRIVDGAANSGAEALIIGTYNGLYYDQQINMVERLLDLGKPTVVVALAMPWDIMAFPDISTYIATYSNRDLALETVARYIFGRAKATGKLPVTIPDMYEYGWSLQQ